MKYPNLIPNCERSPEELREMGRKGGIKSGEARRKKRELQKEFKLWMQVFDDLRSEDEARANRVLDALMQEWYKRNANEC